MLRYYDLHKLVRLGPVSAGYSPNIIGVWLPSNHPGQTLGGGLGVLMAILYEPAPIDLGIRLRFPLRSDCRCSNCFRLVNFTRGKTYPAQRYNDFTYCVRTLGVLHNDIRSLSEPSATILGRQIREDSAIQWDRDPGADGKPATHRGTDLGDRCLDRLLCI